MKESDATLIEDSIRQSRMTDSYIANYDLAESHRGTAYADDPDDFPEETTFTFENGGWAKVF